MDQRLAALLTVLRTILLLLLAPDGPTLTQDLRRGLIAALDVTEDTLGVDRTIPRRRDRR